MSGEVVHAQQDVCGDAEAQAGPVRLTIYNTAGQPVKVLVDQARPAGRFRVAWDGTDSAGRPAGDGVYVYCLQAGAFRQARRLVLLE